MCSIGEAHLTWQPPYWHGSSQNWGCRVGCYRALAGSLFGALSGVGSLAR
jgi:hypothetical protein